MMVKRLPRALTTALVALALIATPAVAQVGHSPFQDTATPVAGDAPGWQVAEVTPLDLAGRAVSLSPDGTTIAGLDAEGALCFWSVPGLAQTCADMPDSPSLSVDPDSIAWAPDSSAIAFSVQAYRLIRDGDIYVVDATSAAMTNITEDGLERVNIMGDEEPNPVDVMPAWTPDSASIVFSRTVFDGREELSTEIMRVPRDGGEVETLLSLPALTGAIFTPMRVLPDGSILYTVADSNQGEPLNGLWRLPPEGEPVQLMPGNRDSAFPAPVINDAWLQDGELRIIGHSPLLLQQVMSETPFAFFWSSDTGEAIPLEAGAEDFRDNPHPGAISPDGQTILALGRTETLWPAVSLQGPASSLTVLPEFEFEGEGQRAIYINATWSDANLVLVSSFLAEGAYLLTVEPVAG